MYMTGQMVTISGNIYRMVQNTKDESPENIAIGRTGMGETYACWYKNKYHPSDTVTAIVLGYTHKKAGYIDSPSITYDSVYGEEYDPGGICIDTTGKAWIVMPVGYWPNRYRKPIVTIEEFMEPIE